MRILIKILTFIIFLFSNSYIRGVESSMTYKTVKMECFPRPEFITNSVCKLKPLNRYKSVSNMDCDIVKPLTNISLRLQMFFKNDANIYKPFLINVTQNICDVLSKRSFAPYSTIALKLLKQTSNVNHTCPYTGHLRARDLYVNEVYLPIDFPIGFFKISNTFLEGYPYQEIGTVNFYIQSIEKVNVRQKQYVKMLNL